MILLQFYFVEEKQKKCYIKNTEYCLLIKL